MRCAIVTLPVLLALFACGKSKKDSTDDVQTTNAPGSAAPSGLPLSDAQTPPLAGKDLEAWLATGAYKAWRCEAAPHASRSPSPHGMNRICSNYLASNFSGSGERPAGTAAVKELYDDTGKTITGYAVYGKGAATSDGGTNWYWYEKVPLTSAAPHDAAGVVADGFGGAGAPKSICVSCHVGAGSDTAHTPTAGGSDQVYTQVLSAAPAAGDQTPPTDGKALEAWLTAGAYKKWHCEASAHAGRSPSPHGMNRVCSNTLASEFSGSGERPVGTAAVKELFDDTGKTLQGYAVYLKTLAASDSGANWYWYERVPLTSAAPHDSAGVVADGLGSGGTPSTICVSCHAAAGKDAAHTPTAGGSDQVYTQVK